MCVRVRLRECFERLRERECLLAGPRKSAATVERLEEIEHLLLKGIDAVGFEVALHHREEVIVEVQVAKLVVEDEEKDAGCPLNVLPDFSFLSVEEFEKPNECFLGLAKEEKHDHEVVDEDNAARVGDDVPVEEEALFDLWRGLYGFFKAPSVHAVMEMEEMVVAEMLGAFLKGMTLEGCHAL